MSATKRAKSEASTLPARAPKARRGAPPSATREDHDWLLREACKIAEGLAQTLAPMWEVVVHDLSNPAHAIVQISNNLSGRAVGDSATELGLARMADPDFPEVIANYANTFADGRPAKSTSIGLKDKSGRFAAAICLNMDLSYVRSMTSYLNELSKIQADPADVRENLASSRRVDIEGKTLAFAASRNRDPRGLTTDDKRELLLQLAEEGDLELRGAADQIGNLLGVSRSNVYYYLKLAREKRGA
jgi:predicted transcriptional regulator YheO